MHAFWLVLTYDLWEDRCIDDAIIKTFFSSVYHIKQIDRELENNKKKNSHTINLVAPKQTSVWKK